MEMITKVALLLLTKMEIKRLLNMPHRGNGQYQKMMLTGQLKVKDTLLEAQANLMGSKEPLRLKWLGKARDLYQVSGMLSMK